MIPIGAEATDAVLAWSDGLHRTVALHHAAIHGRPGLWGDDRSRPATLIWLRDGGDQWEAFAAGSADLAIDWLHRIAVGRPIVLAAPPAWEPTVRASVGRSSSVEQSVVQTWLRPEIRRRLAPSVDIRPLDHDDAAEFAAVAPPWALRSWADFDHLIDRGAALGVPGRSGLVALAWVVESDHFLDKVGVATDPRFRGLGLGRAVASALVDHVEEVRHRQPLWVANPANVASLAIARSLGFTTQLTETLLRWTP